MQLRKDGRWAVTYRWWMPLLQIPGLAFLSFGLVRMVRSDDTTTLDWVVGVGGLICFVVLVGFSLWVSFTVRRRDAAAA